MSIDRDSLIDKDTPLRVAYFMQAGGQKVPDSPEVPEPKVQNLRIDLITEEFNELQEAYEDEDIEGIVDAGIDLAIVALGAALDAAPAHAVMVCLKAILMANENKIMDDGTIHVREDGKIEKPPGWVQPDIHSILRLYQKDATPEEVLEGLSCYKEGLGL